MKDGDSPKTRPMQILAFALATVVAILSIGVGALLYYQRETAACWLTFVTVVAAGLGVCVYWQDAIWAKQKAVAGNTPSAQPSPVENPSSAATSADPPPPAKPVPATLREFFDTDFDYTLRAQEDRILTFKGGQQVTIVGKLYMDFQGRSEFVGFYIPRVTSTFVICKHLIAEDGYKAPLALTKQAVEVEGGVTTDKLTNSNDLQFSGRVFIYHEAPLLEREKDALRKMAEKKKLAIQFRGGDYVFSQHQTFTPPKPQNTNAETSVRPGHEGALIEMSTKIEHPRVFISYSWEGDDHKAWVRDVLATRLRGNGVEAVLDQWELVPGDQLPQFMETAIRDNDFVVIVCTPEYKQKADGRKGGVGYEGDIMTAEVLTDRNRRKFIPVLRSGDWNDAIPTWLRGSYALDLRDGKGFEGKFEELVDTLHGTRPTAPPVSPRPSSEARPSADHRELLLAENPVGKIPDDRLRELHTELTGNIAAAETRTRFPLLPTLRYSTDVFERAENDGVLDALSSACRKTIERAYSEMIDFNRYAGSYEGESERERMISSSRELLVSLGPRVLETAKRARNQLEAEILGL